jgi:hypothetical protein
MAAESKRMRLVDIDARLKQRRSRRELFSTSTYHTC